MAQKKFSQLDAVTPTINDSIPYYDADTITTARTLISTLITLIFNNIPAGSPSPITRFDEALWDFAASGGVWTGDSYNVNRNASMTALIVYINGQRISIGAVSARTFTASKDTYIDVLDNQDGTGTLVYTEVANNAASPALASNSFRLGIIVTGASAIVNVGSINQGEEDKILPIASSIAYSVTDSIGNLINNRCAKPGLIGYRQITAGISTTSVNTDVDATGLNACPFKLPLAGKVRAELRFDYMTTDGASATIYGKIKSGATVLAVSTVSQPGASFACSMAPTYIKHLAAGAYEYKAAIRQNVAGTLNLNAASTGPAHIAIYAV